MESIEKRHNSLGQPIGAELSDWQPAKYPPRDAIRGQYCSIEPLDAKRHSTALYRAFSEDGSGKLWTYMANGPFHSAETFEQWLETIESRNDRLDFAIIDANDNNAVGIAAYLRIAPDVGSIEVGSITYSPLLQKTRMATEAMYLMMKHAFDTLGYRRYEWKCDSLNSASQSAALRLGFQFEGVFRQGMVYKGRSRDTAWYSIIDSEWPAISADFKAWLESENFDAQGRQRSSLKSF